MIDLALDDRLRLKAYRCTVLHWILRKPLRKFESQDGVARISEPGSGYPRPCWREERYGLGEASAPPTTGPVVMCPELRCSGLLPSNDFRDRRDEPRASRGLLAKESLIEWVAISCSNPQVFHFWMRRIDQIVAAFWDQNTRHFQEKASPRL